MGARFRSVATNTADPGGSLAIAVPSGVVNGDLLLMCAAAGGGLNFAGSGFNAVAGWNLIDHGTGYGGGSGLWADATTWWKVANAEPASYTITDASGSGTHIQDIGAIIAYQGVSVAAPVKSHAPVAPNGWHNTTSPTPGSLSGVASDDVSIICYVWNDDSGTGVTPTLTTPAGWTSRANIFTSSANGYNPGMQVVDKVAGTDTPTISSGSNAGAWSVLSVALRANRGYGNFLPFLL